MSKVQAFGLEPGTKPWEDAAAFIRHSARILLICHVSPDGDAIGSLLGLGRGLRMLGKTPTLACESSPPRKFSFLPDFETIVSVIEPYPYDLVIGLDCSDTTRLGKIYNAERMDGVPLINIDHHVTNLLFGDVNLVNTKAASTAEVVLRLLDHLGVPLDQDGAGIALCLLTGVVTDTLGFRTSNVTPQVMASTIRLMEAGASLSEITHYAFNQRPLVELSLLAHGLSRMHTEGALAWTEIALADRHACGHRGSSDAGLVDILVRTREIHVAAVFSEMEDNQVDISFRADPGFDVAQLALSLGGGGHPAASGCKINGSLEAAKARVLPMLRAALEKQQQR
jgi:phosphoesterase RecJ-like protein